MTGPKNTIFEELADEDEESYLQEELLSQVLDGQSTSFHCTCRTRGTWLSCSLEPRILIFKLSGVNLEL
jgi:hypothetical protein